MTGILILTLTSTFALFLLIIHAYYLRGPRTAFNFFFFAFLWAFMKEVHAPKSPLVFPVPYELLDSRVPPVASQFTVTVGWIFTFYLSWCLAEMILNRIKYYKGKLFATLLLSALIIGSISYCMEAPGISVGWWKWKAADPRLADYLVVCPSLAIFAWMFFGMHFLAAFFLIELSRYRDAAWRCVFFLIPVIHIWIMRFFGGKDPVEIEGFIALSIFAVLAFLSRMKIEYGRIGDDPVRRVPPRMLKILRQIPVAMALFMIAVALMLALAVARNPELVIPLLPISLFVLLSIRKIPLIPLFIISAAGFFGPKMYSLIVPGGIVLLFLAVSAVIPDRYK